MENQIIEAPTFTDFWNLTSKIGFKERLAKRWFYLPSNHKIIIFNKVRELKIKPNAEEYLNRGR